jgi:hypothetical protein
VADYSNQLGADIGSAQNVLTLKPIGRWPGWKMNDLFQATKSKKQQILDFIREKHWVKTHEVIAFGSEIFCNLALRTAQELASEGNIKRLSKDEKVFRFGLIKEDVWEYIKG